MTASQTAAMCNAADGEASAMRALFSDLYPDIKRLARTRLAHAGGATG